MICMLTDQVVGLLRRSVLCWLATADLEGYPSASPKEIFVPLPPDRVCVAHIASPRTIGNIKVNPQVCLSAIDVFEQRGYQLYGHAVVVEPSEWRFTELAAPLREMAGSAYQIKGVIEITVSKVAPIVAPSYWAKPELDDVARRASVLAAYGVRPVNWR